MPCVLSAGGAAIGTCIVEYLKEALQVVKACGTEEQRLEYGILLRGVAPPLRKRGDSSGMAAKVAARLEVPYGRRFVKGTKTLVPYAFTQAVAARLAFCAAAKQAARPLKEMMPGDAVICRGQLAELTNFDAQTGHCSVTYRAENSTVAKVVNYLTRFGNCAKSARLQWPPALLLPPSRKARKDKIGEEVLEHVSITYEMNCPTSPHQRDRMRRLLVSRCFEEKQAMIQTSTLKELYEIFGKEYPEDEISFSKFKMLKPWNLKKAYRET